MFTQHGVHLHVTERAHPHLFPLTSSSLRRASDFAVLTNNFACNLGFNVPITIYIKIERY